MGALDHLTNLDNLLASAKQEFAHEKEDLIREYNDEKTALRAQFAKDLQAVKDQLLAANIQTELHKGIAADAHAARAAAERITTSLLTQISSLSKAFEDLRTFATSTSSAAANTLKTVEPPALPSEAHNAVEEAKAAIERALAGSSNGEH